MNRLMCARCAVLLGVAAPVGAISPVIDDFEAGAFIFTCPNSTLCTDSQPIGSHGIANVRDVHIHGNGFDLVSASLVTSAYDDLLSVWGIDPFLNVHYDPPGDVDLTYGPWDSIHIRIDAPGGTLLQVSVYYDAVNGDHAVFNVDPVMTVIRFSQLSGLDLTAVDRLVFSFQLPGGFPTSARLTDIRFGRSTFTNYDAIGSQAIWCISCPPESLRYDILQGSPFPLSEMTVRIENAETVSGVGPSIRLEGFDSGDATGGPGPFAGTALYWDTLSDYETTTYDLLVDFPPAAGQQVTMPSAPVITISDSASVAFQYVLRYDDATGLAGNSVDRVTMDVMPGQPVRFTDVSVTQVVGRSVTAAVAYRLSFTLEAFGDVDETQALLTTQLVGDFASGATPTSVLPEPLMTSAIEGLVAQPSVTREGTVLRLARPRESSGTISIFDVTGRVLRQLGVAAESSVVSWDGRGESGDPLPSGVYWASLPSANERVSAKIVLVR